MYRSWDRHIIISDNQLIKMSRYNRLRHTEEVKVYDLQSPGASYEWKWQERRNSFGNDDYHSKTPNESLHKDFVRVYIDREYYHQQRNELNEKLENSSSCQELSKPHTYTTPFGRSTICQESSLVASLNTKIRYLEQLVRNRDNTISNLQDASESERTDFQFNIQIQNSALREKNELLNMLDRQLKAQKYQCTSEEFQRANECLHEMVHVLEETLHRDGTRLNYAHRPIIYKLVRDDRLFYNMSQLQLKVSEVREKAKDMASSIDKQKETIFSLERECRQLEDNCSQFEKENDRKNKLFKDTMDQREDEFRERISSLNTDKKCLDEEVKLLKKRVECLEKEKWELNEKMTKMAKEHELSNRLRQSSKQVALNKTDVEWNKSVALNNSIQSLDREVKFREMNVKNYEEELSSKNNELKERIISLKGDVKDKDAHISELRVQEVQILKTLHEKDERLRKITTERDDLLSQLKDHQRHQASKQVFKTENDSNEFHKALKNEIQRLEMEMRSKDSDGKYLEEMLEKKKASLDVLEKEVQEMKSQLSEQSVRHRHNMDSLIAKHSDIEERNATLKKEKHHLEAEVKRLNEKNKGLEETLNRKKKEISDTNEQYVRAVKDKYTISSQVSDLQQRTNKTYDSEAESYETITSLKAELKHMNEETKLRDAKVKHLEKMLENKNIKEDERIKQLENKIQGKEDQLSAQKYQHHQVVISLHEKESELQETVHSLQMKIRNIEAEVERCNETNRGLEEKLDHKKKELSDADERYERAINEKDAFSSQVSDLQQRTNKTYYSEAESNRTISALKVEIQQLGKEMKLRDAKAMQIEKELHSKNSNHGKIVSQLENKIHEKDGQLSEQSYQHQQVVRRLREKEAALQETIASLKKKIHDLEVDVLQFISKIKDLEDQLKKTKLVAKAEQKGDVPAMENMIADLKQQLKQARTKLRDTEAELNETKTRLSKAMGERLTDNNPNITDLGDKNRPTKLAERFAELYDNQWTDAFDILEKKFDTEEKAIEALLHILQDAMSFCKTKEREQMEELQRVLVFADKTVPRGEAIDIQRLFKENRKAVASSAVENLLHAYEAHIRRSADERIQMALNVKSYAKECLEICWLMTVQDPPVVFAPLLKKGVQFNNELFRPYTKSGSNVAFVVWPALLLHESGPVLAKGVAQGAGKP